MTILLIVLAVLSLGAAVWLWQFSQARIADRPLETALPLLPSDPRISALRSPNRDVRRAAAKELGESGSVSAVEPLIVALEDEARAVRQAAAEALGALGDRRAVEPLLRTLHDEGWAVRQAAAAALGELGDPRAVEPLLPLLSDPDRSVRRAVVSALGQLGSTRAVEPLLVALRDPDSLVQEAAVQALGRLGDPGVCARLAAVLLDHNAEQVVRQAAAGALGELGDPCAVPPLLDSLRAAEGAVRAAAAAALGTIGAAAVEPLLETLDDQNPRVRSLAAAALGQAGDPRAVEPLTAALQDDDEGVRWAAAGALREIGAPPEIASLLEAAEQEQAVERAARMTRSVMPYIGGGEVIVEAPKAALPPQPAEIPPPAIVEYTGSARLPRRVYEADSQTITIVLKRSAQPAAAGEPLTVEETREGTVIALQLEESEGKELEIELIAAGITIGGEKKQAQPLAAVLTYRWSCFFHSSGVHEMSFILRLRDGALTTELGSIEHRVRVSKLGPLTQRQVQILASFAGIVSGGLTLAEVLRALGVW